MTYGDTRQHMTKKHDIDEKPMQDAKHDDNAQRRCTMMPCDDGWQQMTATTAAKCSRKLLL